MSARIDITGLRFGRLTAIRYLGPENGRAAYLMRCDCGTEKSILRTNLRKRPSQTKSCGCLKLERAPSHLRPQIRHGRSTSSTYRSWEAMKRRCLNPKAINFANYGGQGIVPCKSWIESFEAFYAEMRDRPLGMTLDRIDNSLGYFKENCRWATKKEQRANQRSKALRQPLSP